MKGFRERYSKRLRGDARGFTLAELLIVVAIIAVLVAIAIPIFIGQLNKSKDSVSVANVRAAYAEATAALIQGQDGTDGNITVSTSGGKTTVTVANVYLNVATDNLSGQGKDLPIDNEGIQQIAAKKGSAANYNITFGFPNSDGKATISQIKKTD